MFTIFGVTGNTGKVVAEALLARGKKVRVVGRNPEKLEGLRTKGAEVVQGDVTDEKSVARALRDAEGAYLLVPPDPTSQDLVGRGRAIVRGYENALREVKVPHVVVLSSIAAHVPSGTGPIVIARAAELGLAELPNTRATFVRAAYFMENHLANVHPMKADGVLPVFGGGEAFPFPMVATHDIGTVAADALLGTPKENEWIELSGPKEYSFEDVAEAASQILGRSVKATPAPIDALVPTFMKFGISENVAGLYREMTEASGKGLMRFEGKGRSLRGKVTIAEVLRPALLG